MSVRPYTRLKSKAELAKIRAPLTGKRVAYQCDALMQLRSITLTDGTVLTGDKIPPGLNAISIERLLFKDQVRARKLGIQMQALFEAWAKRRLTTDDAMILAHELIHAQPFSSADAIELVLAGMRILHKAKRRSNIDAATLQLLEQLIRKYPKEGSRQITARVARVAKKGKAPSHVTVLTYKRELGL